MPTTDTEKDWPTIPFASGLLLWDEYQPSVKFKHAGENINTEATFCVIWFANSLKQS